MLLETELAEKTDNLKLMLLEEIEANEASLQVEKDLGSRLILGDGFLFFILSPRERIALHHLKKITRLSEKEILVQNIRAGLSLDYEIEQYFNGRSLNTYFRLKYDSLIDQRGMIELLLNNLNFRHTRLTDIISPHYQLLLEVLNHLQARQKTIPVNSFRVLCNTAYYLYCELARLRKINSLTFDEFQAFWGNLMDSRWE